MITLKQIDQSINYERLFYFGSLAFHAVGLFYVCLLMFAFYQILGFSGVWPKIFQIIPLYIFVAVYSANALEEKKMGRFVFGTLTNFLVMFTV